MRSNYDNSKLYQLINLSALHEKGIAMHEVEVCSQAVH